MAQFRISTPLTTHTLAPAGEYDGSGSVRQLRCGLIVLQQFAVVGYQAAKSDDPATM